MTTKYLGRVVLPDYVVDKGAVCVSDGVITYSGSEYLSPEADVIVDHSGKYIAPGFVDIHCHAGDEVYCHEDPVKMSRYHLAHGTTSLLCTLYRDLTHIQLIEGIEKIKSAMSECTNIAGIHMEGPYLNPKYGAHVADSCNVNPDEYNEYIASGIVKQWTSAPEVDGVMELISQLSKSGIVPAIGHSMASPEEVREAHRRGARIVTHLFDATGASISPSRYDGTIETTFDVAALVCDNFYHEIICDKGGIHVRPDMVRLAIKAAGIDRIVAVTDCCAGGIDDGSDVNIENGELNGSKMTMDQAARNFFALGLTVPEVFRVTAANPAAAVRLDYAGTLSAGKRGDLLVLDNELNLEKVYKA